MRQCSSQPGLRANNERDRWLCRLDGEPSGRRCAETAYAAFCREHWSLYWQFAAAVTGGVAGGRGLALAALRELGAQWGTALRSSSPSGYSWALLADVLAPHRTEGVRLLYGNLRTPEADALVLRHRLGCSADAAGRAMGLSPDAFELLRRMALTNAAALGSGWHMPASDAV